jgi:hypothetical protein
MDTDEDSAGRGLPILRFILRSRAAAERRERLVVPSGCAISGISKARLSLAPILV